MGANTVPYTLVSVGTNKDFFPINAYGLWYHHILTKGSIYADNDDSTHGLIDPHRPDRRLQYGSERPTRNPDRS